MFPMTPLQSWAFLALVAMLIVNVVVLWNELAVRFAVRVESAEDTAVPSEHPAPSRSTTTTTASAPQLYDHERDGI